MSVIQQMNIPIMDSKEFVVQNTMSIVVSQLGHKDDELQKLTERKAIQKYEKKYNILTMSTFAVFYWSRFKHMCLQLHEAEQFQVVKYHSKDSLMETKIIWMV